MKKLFYILSVFLFVISITSLVSAGEQLRVAVIDSGLDIKDPRFSNLICKEGGTNNFTNESLKDKINHGTHVTGLIKEYAKDSNYCLIIVKYYEVTTSSDVNTLRMDLAIQYALDNGANIINISSSGPDPTDVEKKMISSHPNVTFIVSAGNDSKELSRLSCNSYPACYFYPNVISVGSINSEGEKSSFSNYGPQVSVVEVGENVESTSVPKHICSKKVKECFTIDTTVMSGTSQACAIHTGKVIYAKTHP